jgi:uncharacterized damage-inducible protein DinB
MVNKFAELFQYNLDCNAAIIDAFQTHAQQLPQKVDVLLCHIISAQQVWNSRILELPSFAPWQMHSTNELHGINHKNYQDSIRIIQDFDLNKTIAYQNTKGLKFEKRIDDILFHVINHGTYHRGQIAMLFRESGVAPLSTDYIFYGS